MMPETASAPSEPATPLEHPVAVLEQLELARGQLEARFLAAGNMLSAAVDGIGAIIAVLDKLILSADPVTTAATTGDLGVAAARLSALPAAQAARRAIVAAIGESGVSLDQYIFDMWRSLAYMRAFAVNIKITASGIASYNTDFAVFAQGISGSIEQGRAELDGLQTDVVALKRELKKANAHGAALESRCNALIPAIPNDLSASAKVMGSHHQQIATAAGGAAELARDIRKKVGRILAALQIGDITRQRIEHVQTGLGMLETCRAALPAEPAARLASLFYALMLAQLEATVADFAADVAAIDTGIAGLAGDLLELLRLGEVAYGRTAGEKDGFLRTLDRRVAQALGLVREIEVADQIAVATGEAVSAAVQALTARVAALQQIKADVHYMAVNTTLKSTRVGEAGRPLGVIAVELRAHGGHLATAAAACLTILEALRLSASTLIDDDASSTQGTQAAAAALGTASERIRAAGDRSEGDITVLSSEGETLLRLLRSSSSRTGLLGDIGATLDDAVATLAAAGGDAMASRAGIEEPLRTLLTGVGAIYTMAQERSVQHAFAAAWGLAAALDPGPAAPPADADLADALF
jgi:hypothetical protein